MTSLQCRILNVTSVSDVLYSYCFIETQVIPVQPNAVIRCNNFASRIFSNTSESLQLLHAGIAARLQLACNNCTWNHGRTWAQVTWLDNERLGESTDWPGHVYKAFTAVLSGTVCQRSTETGSTRHMHLRQQTDTAQTDRQTGVCHSLHRST